MYSGYQDQEELEDDLYQEDGDSDVSEVNSELEFHLYSQLHYSSNAGEMEELGDRGEAAECQGSQKLELTTRSADDDREQEPTRQNSLQSPNISDQELNEKRGSKCHKRKISSIPKGRISPFSFEEVIVIDSSPDVISISDGSTSSDDIGVCALKGQDPQRLQTSTPAQQGNLKRIGAPGMPLTVTSSSSESDLEELQSKSDSSSLASSDSSDSSESDDLENWMILGRGNQDGDQSISLNLEGGTDSNADVEEGGSWLVSDKDREAQIFNKDKGVRTTVQRVLNRYYTSKSVQCRNCNKSGHLSKNCPEPKKLSPCFLCGTLGHLVSQCPNKHCNNCGLPGHLYESCSERAYWHKQCHRCNMTGHFFDACPEIWRQYHITTKAGTPVKQQANQTRTSVYCYNCSKKGHYGHTCTKQRMFNGTYPATSFINRYDTVEDIKRRQHRIKLKVKELKKNGLFSASSQMPLTPGPPRKKQKISHHKNNHQSNHTPHQSPHNHKPSKNHIFFNDSCEVKGPAPKMNEYKPCETTGNVKPWKPKRPVPATRNTASKLIIDETEDFPRGGAKGETVKKRKKKMKKPKQVSSMGLEGQSRPNHPPWVGEMQRSMSQPEKRKRKKPRNAWKKHDVQMYPTDENLFIIKQRRRRR